jgi:cytochrome c peroxidase
MLLLLAACTPELDDTEWEVAGQMSPPPALPADPTNRVADDEAAATLGQRLFFDTGLSSNGEVACATCHDPE